MLDPTTGSLVEYADPDAGQPRTVLRAGGITSDEHGNVWLSELDGRLGRIAAGTTTIEEFAIPYRPDARGASLWTSPASYGSRSSTATPSQVLS